MKRFHTAKILLLSLLLVFALALTACSSDEGASENFSLSETELSMMTGQIKTLQVNDLKGIGQDSYTVYWGSENSAVATVDSAGTVTARGVGTCNVVAAVRTADGEEQLVCAVTVTENTLKLTAIAFNASIYTLGEGQSLNLKEELRLSPAEALAPNLVWKSSKETIATVNDGVVVPVSQGISTITVTSEDGLLSASCVVQVSEIAVEATDIAFEEAEVTISLGQTKILKTTVTPSNATGYSVIWTSSDPTVATVDAGAVTAYKEGTATITARLNKGTSSITAECIVTVERVSVEVPATSVSLTPDSISVTSDNRLTHHFEAKIEPVNCTQTAVWSTNKPDLVKIDEKTGVFSIIKAPSTEGITGVLIICTVGDVEASAIFYIENTELQLLAKPAADTVKDKAPFNTTTVAAYLASDDKTPLTNVTWTSSDPTVATVDKDGKVTGLKVGKVTLTGTCTIDEKPYTVSSEITVQAADYISLTVGEKTTIPREFLPENPSQNLAEWSLLPGYVNIDVAQNTIEGLKATPDAPLIITVPDAQGGAYAIITVYIQPAPASQSDGQNP